MRLLLISYEFPPKGGPGIQRPLQIARLLDAAGWDVTVLTVKDPPTAVLDPSAEAQIPAGVRVVRAWSLEPTRVLQWLRRMSRRPAPPIGAGGYSGAPTGVIRFVQAFFLPDEKLGWTPWAVRAALRQHAEEPFDVILASGPPFTAYRVAWKLASRLGVPWVADVRDPIVDNYFFSPPTSVHAHYMRRFERRIARSAARVIAATPQIRDDIAARNPMPSDRVLAITNGFDPEQFQGPAPLRNRRAFTVSYVGSFLSGSPSEPFLDAVRIAIDREPSLATDLRVRVVGPAGDPLVAAVGSRGLGDVVELVGFVPHDVAVTEMRSADVLLLVLADFPHLRAVLTGKLPEYLGARRPVLALVPDGAARDVLVRTGAAAVVASGDVEAAAEALLGMYRQWKAGELPEPDPEVVAEFDRTRLVARLGSVLEAVVGEGA